MHPLQIRVYKSFNTTLASLDMQTLICDRVFNDVWWNHTDDGLIHSNNIIRKETIRRHWIFIRNGFADAFQVDCTIRASGCMFTLVSHRSILLIRWNQSIQSIQRVIFLLIRFLFRVALAPRKNWEFSRTVSRRVQKIWFSMFSWIPVSWIVRGFQLSLEHKTFEIWIF